MSYNDFRGRKIEQNSESDLEPENNQFKITSNPNPLPQKRPHLKYDESSESDISSLSEDQQQEQQSVGRARLDHNKRTIELEHSGDSESDSSSQSSGIDVIEQRIKRLESDLQAKIQKQKKTKEEKEQPPQKGKMNAPLLKNVLTSNPPLPPQKLQSKVNVPISHKQAQVFSHPQSQNTNKSNIIQKNCLKQTTKPTKEEAFLSQIAPLSSVSPKKSSPTKITEDKISSKPHKSKHKSKNLSKNQPNTVALLHKAQRQIDQMQKTIEGLRIENDLLREQLDKTKKKQTTQELLKLRKLSSGGGDLKLEKQIQTLKAIESLQVKLKKSIGKKMKKERINSTNSGVAQQL